MMQHICCRRFFFLMQVCNHTCVAPSMDRPLVVGDIAFVFRVSVQSATENGFHLLPLGSLILQQSAHS